MSTTKLEGTLDERVDTLEQKSNRIEQSKNTKKQVESSCKAIDRICRRLDDVRKSADELRFFVHVYEGAFADDGDRPDGLQARVETAVQNVDIGDDELLEAARNRRISELEDRVEEAHGTLEDAIDDVKTKLDVTKSRWNDDLGAARELNRIVGADSGFEDLIEEMQDFLDSEMWNTYRNPADLTDQWNRYEGRWAENAGKHGWDTFQAEHDLADRTIEELQQFGDGDPVRLADLSMSTLEEIKEVPDLESSLELEVRS